MGGRPSQRRTLTLCFRGEGRVRELLFPNCPASVRLFKVDELQPNQRAAGSAALNIARQFACSALPWRALFFVRSKPPAFLPALPRYKSGCVVTGGTVWSRAESPPREILSLGIYGW